jgi:hypothetical protein
MAIKVRVCTNEFNEEIGTLLYKLDGNLVRVGYKVKD